MKLFDSSPLIAILGNLSNPELLTCFISIGYTLYVPTKVVEEITKEPEKKLLEKMIFKKEINKLEPIDEQEIQNFRNRYPELGKGESELILWGLQLNKETKKFCCIIDDRKATKIANRFGLKCNGTIGLLKKLNDKGLINTEKLNSCYETLEKYGFWYKFKKINVFPSKNG